MSMPVLTTRDQDRASIAAAFADPSRLVVVSLCAAWCDACSQFRAAFERLAAARPDTAFVWLDIEDDADAAGDIDVDNFPTLAIYRGDAPVHFGVSLPHETTIGRLIDALATHAQPLASEAAVSALPARLCVAMG
jgi:thioredoxin reductase (NADPH)